MLITILKRIYRQLVLLAVVSLVLLATYVSAGRQFMPAIARYSSFLEQQIFEVTGVPVTIDSVTGSFEGFNPRIRINGLRFPVDEQADGLINSDVGALVFDSATLIVDMARSVWQRRWVLEDFVVESLELDIEQTPQGNWQLSGVNVSGDSAVNPDSIFQTLQRLSNLTLSNLVVNIETRFGDSFTLNNGSATIQNQGNTHLLHIDANLEPSHSRIVLSFEATGNELSEVDARIHARLPPADYSNLLRGEIVGDFRVDELIGGGDLWVELEDGRLTRAVTQAGIDSLTLAASRSQPITLEGLSGSINLSRGDAPDHWELTFADMAVNWENHYWRPFNVYFNWAGEESLSARADHIDLALIGELAVSSGLLNPAMGEDLAQYAPDGALENFSLHLSPTNAAEGILRVKSNLNGAQLGSVRGSPNMWGVNGYFEAVFDSSSRLMSGFAEVESDEFSVNLPTVFTEVWDFGYVNGKLDFRLDLNDGRKVSLVTGPTIAESEVLDGRIQFSSTVHNFPDGRREAELELLAGARRVDAEFKSLYLPDGQNVQGGLRASMEWLDTAILDGDVYDSGLVFRGNSLAGSPPETKTFQSFYLMSDGEFNFSDAWPTLENLSAIVSTDDDRIDVEVLNGSSLGIELGAASGEIRKNEQGESWLQISGGAAGATADGLSYLQQSAVGDNIKRAFADWQMSGDFRSDIQVRMPLNRPDLDTEVRLEIAVADNSLVIPRYGLDMDRLAGPVVFDTTTGLEDSTLEARLFDRPTTVDLSSQSSDGELRVISVGASGGVSKRHLTDWPLQSGFVRSLLTRMEGEIEYAARLNLPLGADNAAPNTLVIDSDLRGAALNLPAPFAKPSTAALPLHLALEFGAGEAVAGSLGPDLAFELELSDGEVNDGVIYIGRDPPDAAGRNGGGVGEVGEVEGLAVVGELDRLQLEQWTGFLADVSLGGSPAEDLSGAVAFADLQLGVLELYGQELAEVAIRIEPDPVAQGWLARLVSDSVQGRVTIPYRGDDYRLIELDHLRLPGEEEEALIEDPDTVGTRVFEPEEEPVDVLADIDPRELPRMKFATGEFLIGSRSYGSWGFTLDATDRGAEVSDLSFDFRGLRLGPDGAPPVDGETGEETGEETGAVSYEPHFNWLYDGSTHRSELRGILHADNMADVLTANGYAASFESDNALFHTDISWPGSPAFFAASGLSGNIEMEIEDGRFLRDSGGPGALKLVSIINLNAIMRRARLSDDMLRSGLAYDEITARINLRDGLVTIEDQLVISGPSSLYQISGEIDLAEETILGEMYVTLPVSDNIPWLGLVTGNLPLAVGAYLFDRIFGAQVDSLTSAVYTLNGPWEGLRPEFKQAFGSPESAQERSAPLQ